MKMIIEILTLKVQRVKNLCLKLIVRDPKASNL